MSTAEGAGARATARYDRDSVEFSRAVAFFDAAYAFALTLLVVNIDPPPAEDWATPARWVTSGLGWQFFGFAVSFIVIAVFWRVNHRLGSEFTGFSSGTITANLVALALIVFIPFSTQGISDPATADEPLAVAVYAVNISVAVMAQSAVYLVARRDRLLRHPLPRRADTVNLIDAMSTPAVFLLSIPVAYLWGAEWGRWCWLLLIVVGPISGRWAARRVARIVSEERPAPPPAPSS
ncbi:TMEM175 family protein [Agromyces larvae]|uniref:TMEM175 family protein n=1 Tax=Agromyces larvae TaxID=2929802 RepID=A0ABY4C305_9MICO|nr:TMEM175 family protein [Agromyces larvae]UOE45852.1 TMEM175 family protein [Agromyces larvae]